MRERSQKNVQKYYPHNAISIGIFFVAFVLSLLLFIHLSKVKTFDQGTVCIHTETITNGGRSTPIGAQRCTLSLELANTQELREKGLSGLSLLPASQGMLFIFDQVGTECMWMKDMKFSIDILWLDAHKTVTKVVTDISPETYPMQYCAENTAFVIEVAAGVSNTPGLQVGSRINL
jgi:uncharacterized membrane protein (UPF0127 family)